MGQNQQIKFLHFFAIVLVCIGHSFTAVESVYGHNWIYGFHMPLFIFISGYLLAYSARSKNTSLQNIALGEKNGFIAKKAKRLLLPYLVISSLTFIPKTFLSAYALRPIDFSFTSYIHMLLWPNDNVIKFFWFLPTLFLISIATVIFLKIKVVRNSRIIQGTLIAGLLIINIFGIGDNIGFLAIGRICHLFIFFILGIIFCYKEPRILRYLKLSKPHSTFLLLAVYSILVYFHLSSMQFLQSLLGILFSFSFSYIYTQANIHILDRFYGSSYTIYLFSWYPCTAVQILSQFFALPWGIEALTSTILQILIPYFIYWIIIKIGQTYRYGYLLTSMIGQSR